MLTSETNLHSPEVVYDRLISLESAGAIDNVYSLVFERIEPEYQGAMCEMLALLLAAFEPLTVDDLDDILKQAKLHGSAKALFNICRLESSFYLNKQIPDLDIRISKYIPRRLRYASSHWLFHVSGMDNKRPCPLENDVGYILRSPLVLYWMEVLSFTRSVPRAIDGLRALSDNMALGEEIRWRINDTLRCLIAFLVPIQESAPHIYISALPFMPKKSILRIEGLKKYSETLRVTQGLEEVYPGLPDSLRGHSDSVLAVAFSPDGSRIVSGSTTRQFDFGTQRLVSRHWVNAVAFSPDGSRIVSGSRDQTIRLWDAKTGEPHSVTAVAFSPDGSRIVSGSLDQTIRLWDAKTAAGQRRRILARRLTNRLWLDDQTIRLWDAKTGEPVGDPLRGHSDSVNAVAFSPDGSRIVSGSWDQTIRLWDAKTALGQRRRILARRLTNRLWLWDQTIRLWDAKTGEPVGDPLRGHSSSVTAVAFSPDGSRIVSGSLDQTIRLWDAKTGEPVGDPLRGHSHSDQTIRLWDAKTGEPVGDPLRGHSNSVNAVAFSPDGSRIVSGSWDQTIRLWDAKTGEPVGDPLRGHSSWVNAVAFSPDGSRIVSGSSDQTIRLWDAKTGEPVGDPLRGHSSSVLAVAFSPDGSRIVSGSDDQTIRLWDAKTATRVNAVAFSPDGSRIVSGSLDQTIRLWDAKTGEPVGDPLRGHSHSVNAVAFSPDGSRIVSGSRTRQFDFGTQRLVSRSSVTAVAFSPDGSRIVSGSGTRQFDFGTQRLRSVTAVAISQSDSQLVSGSQDNTIRLWDTDIVLPSNHLFQHRVDQDNATASLPENLAIISGSTSDMGPVSRDAFGRYSGEDSRSQETEGTPQPSDIPQEMDGIPLNTLIPGFNQCSLVHDGWVQSSGRFLFWVPPNNRHGLQYPQSLLTMPKASSLRVTKLDFSHFQCGPSWAKVRTTATGELL
ncbi:SubName: Full=Uncharacterized protein {ECO:0000313/EMBL:KIO01502.1}; Flags: Fragment [Serendipita indica DSM 11827]|nr:SubName: Full=Uncharacterized protein {ECO:0000313/EMBL:KIO01502.1}; Flags: Fragment [Serendipita indica DSM 11827]